MLNKVTITGADDNTPIRELVALSIEFPFVEWGILVSAKQQGSMRFPSLEWMTQFVAAVEFQSECVIDISMHVCGYWVRRMLMGMLEWDELPIVKKIADRIQINTHAEEHITHNSSLDWMAGHNNRQFIFQLDGVNDHMFDAASHRHMNVSGLFDCSHGAGLLPKSWPFVADNRLYGYAGGLGPDNVEEQIKVISGQRRGPGLPESPYWIDMEGNVRDYIHGTLDLKKVRRVLEICAPYIGEQT